MDAARQWSVLAAGNRNQISFLFSNEHQSPYFSVPAARSTELYALLASRPVRLSSQGEG